MSELQIAIFDVQHGSAAFVQTPNDKYMMIDLGIGSIKDSQATFSPLKYVRRKWGISRLDLVLITHPHCDHIDDIFNFDELSPRVLIRPTHLIDQEVRAGNQGKDRSKVDKYLEVHHRYNQPVSRGANVTATDNNGRVDFQTFHPSSCDHGNLNNHSIVSIITFAGIKILIPGDNESCSWNELFDDVQFVAAIKNTHVLIAPHHGRESGYCSELFEHFQPLLTIISDGPAETTAVSKYSAVSRGWEVRSRSNPAYCEKRKCLTTRSDKGIDIRCIDRPGQRTGNLEVTIT